MKTYDEIIQENRDAAESNKSLVKFVVGFVVFAMVALSIICRREDAISVNNGHFLAGEQGFSYKNRDWWVEFRKENDPKEYMNR